MMQTAEIETARPVIRIVDDDEVFLASQKFFFETFFPEVRVWPCAERFLDEEDLSAPGCLILDYRMPDRSGLEVQRALLLRRKPMLPIIFLSAHGDIGTAVHAIRNGAVDFLEKPVEPEALLAKVRTAVAWSLDAFKREHDRRRMELQVLSLTGREREVIDLAVKGMHNKEIADLLG
ncbi:response regulator transcription factor, partial [Sutterella wadsworthensis]|uniref:response regulator transcription factor n=1 Tax=Sutterella wadsworthensis TaxID=40545 RepID=UPI00402A8556